MASIITEYPKNYQNRIERVCDEKKWGVQVEQKRNRKEKPFDRLMAGISIGFAVWGSVRLQPDTWLANGNVQMAQSRMPAVQEIGKAVQRTGKAVQDAPETGNRLFPCMPECRFNGRGQWTHFIWKGRAADPAHGQYYQNHDLYSCAGAGKPGRFL